MKQISIFALILFVFAFIYYSIKYDEKRLSSPKRINETLSTQYFDVTINKASLHSRVDTGNQFFDLPRAEGTQYLILNITFKNIDIESRTILDGEVIINYNGKEYHFDKSEVILAEGWGLLLDQINPLTSKTTNLVYKIPSNITGLAFYRPGRSNSSDLIAIGNISLFYKITDN